MSQSAPRAEEDGRWLSSGRGEQQLQGGRFDPTDPSVRRRDFQSLINNVAVQRLEDELKQFVWSVPFREPPTYPGGPQPAPQRFCPPDQAPSPPRTREEVTDRVYSRSAVQRFLLQKLAADLHKTEEAARTFHDISVFRDVLRAPDAPHLERLHPHVVPVDRSFARPEHCPHSPSLSSSLSSLPAAGTPETRHGSLCDGDTLDATAGRRRSSTSHGSLGGPSARDARRHSAVGHGPSQYQHQRRPEGLNDATADALALGSGATTAARDTFNRGPRPVLDMSHLNVDSGEFLIYRRK